ncbi:hypothetical protein [Chondrinema litorale]|uniref:hypothetical protein n=1 Tax=Chondrinema litorale TaxID=2994555 RepID=UPI002543F7EA|nr:hypothetical protein [Chondrinema litorale]UZR92508.1 hypothetical protein OQ292_11615 [Chondrinema litorale]
MKHVNKYLRKNSPLWLTICLVYLASQATYAQFWNEEDEGYLYKKEFTYGINFNTNGGLIGGATFKFAKVINQKMYHSYSFEFVHVKDPKEQKATSFLSGNNFVPEKKNYFYILRPQYGREIVLFKKAKEQGVQVNWINSVGPTIGLLAPYLIQYRYPDNIVKTEPYDPDIHQSFDGIIGAGSIFESLAKSKIKPGASLKSSLSFEFGTFNNSVTGFEAGFMLDTFFSDIQLMHDTPTKRVYTSAFVTLFYGFRK